MRTGSNHTGTADDAATACATGPLLSTTASPSSRSLAAAAKRIGSCSIRRPPVACSIALTSASLWRCPRSRRRSSALAVGLQSSWRATRRIAAASSPADHSAPTAAPTLVPAIA